MNDYQLPAPILRGGEHCYTIDTILLTTPATHLQDGQRPLFGLVLPSWQRPEVWDAARKRKFIEGIFLGLGTGYYVCTSFDWGDGGARRKNAGLLLDGQQRLTALRDFVSGEISIFDGIKYEHLSIADRRKHFHGVVFPSIEMECTTDERVLREIYDRLAFGGVPHKESERALPAGT